MKKLTISAICLLFLGLVLSSCKTGGDCPAYRSQVNSEQMN